MVVGRAPLYMTFKGDAVAELITRRVSNAVHEMYNAAKLDVWFTNVPMMQFELEDRLSMHFASFCIYSFTCSCRADYIGRTTRRLLDRAREHHPAWLNSGISRVARSAIASHLAETNHRVNRKTHSP